MTSLEPTMGDSPQSVHVMETAEGDSKLPFHYRVARCLLCCFPGCGLLEPETEGSENIQFQWYDVLLTLLSILLHLLDIAADVLLAMGYRERQETNAFIATVFIVSLSSLVGTAVSLYFFHKEDKAEAPDHHHRESESWSKCCWRSWRCFLSLLQLWHMIRSLEYVYYGCQSRSGGLSAQDRKAYYEKLKLRDKHKSFLAMFETTLESVPQLFVQISFIFSLQIELKGFQGGLLVAKLLMSWLGIAWSMTSLQTSIRNADDDKKPMTLKHKLACLPWRAAESGVVVLCHAFAVSRFSHVTSVVFFAVILFWRLLLCNYPMIYCMKKDDGDSRWYNYLLAIALSFGFLHFHSERSRGRYVLFYFLFYLYYYVHYASSLSHGENRHDVHVFMRYAGGALFVVHVSLLLVYHKCCHPSARDIPYCVSCGQFCNCCTGCSCCACVMQMMWQEGCVYFLCVGCPLIYALVMIYVVFT